MSSKRIARLLEGGDRDSVDAEDYDWSEQYNNTLREILDYSATRPVRGYVGVKGRPEGGGWGSYGDTLQDVTEAVEFTDGTLLVCATVSSWGGTFASHDEIRVRYFVLTPK